MSAGAALQRALDRSGGCEVGEDAPAALRGLGDKGDAPGCLGLHRRRRCGVPVAATAAAIRSGWPSYGVPPGPGGTGRAVRTLALH